MCFLFALLACKRQIRRFLNGCRRNGSRNNGFRCRCLDCSASGGGRSGGGRRNRKLRSRGLRRLYRGDRRGRRSSGGNRDNFTSARNAAGVHFGIRKHFSVNAQKEFLHSIHFFLSTDDLKLVERIAHLVSRVHNGLRALRLLLCRSARIFNYAFCVIVTLLHVLIERLHVTLVPDADAGSINRARDRAERERADSSFADAVPVRRIVFIRDRFGKLRQAGFASRISESGRAAEGDIRQYIILLSERAEELQPAFVDTAGKDAAGSDAGSGQRHARGCVLCIVVVAGLIAILCGIGAAGGDRANNRCNAGRDFRADLRRARYKAEDFALNSLCPVKALFAVFLSSSVTGVCRLIKPLCCSLSAANSLIVNVALRPCNG